MKDNKEVFKNLAGLVFTTGLAVATGGASSGLGLQIVNLIASNLSGSFLEKTSYGKIKKLINGVDPSELNHDLQKLIAQAAEFAVRNIEILYAKQLEQDIHRRELKVFSKNLISEIKLLEHILKEKDEFIYKIIEHKDGNAQVFKTFDIRTTSFPVINPESPFNLFFEQHFKPNLELAFSELLKDEKNRPALVAYQRAVYKNLNQDIGKIIGQNDEILQKLNTTERKRYKKENDELKQIQTKILETNPERPSDEFLKSIELRQEELLRETAEIQADISIIKSLVKGVGKDVQVKWIPKEKVLVFSILAVLGVTAAFFIHLFSSKPFNANVALLIDPKTKIHQKYPKLETGNLRFYFPSETKVKEVTNSNEIILAEIPKKMKGQKIRAELIHQYWKLKEDSITLKDGNLVITRVPNESLGVINGRVMSKSGEQPVEGVLISDNTLKDSTDERGRFKIKVPTHLRRIQYNLRIEKEGYKTTQLEYYAGSEIDIRLNVK